MQGEENIFFQSCHIITLKNVRFPAKNYQAHKETKKYSPCARGGKKKLIETAFEEAHALYLLILTGKKT